MSQRIGSKLCVKSEQLINYLLAAAFTKSNHQLSDELSTILQEHNVISNSTSAHFIFDGAAYPLYDERYHKKSRVFQAPTLHPSLHNKMREYQLKKYNRDSNEIMPVRQGLTQLLNWGVPDKNLLCILPTALHKVVMNRHPDTIKGTKCSLEDLPPTATKVAPAIAIIKQRLLLDMLT